MRTLAGPNLRFGPQCNVIVEVSWTTSSLKERLVSLMTDAMGKRCCVGIVMGRSGGQRTRWRRSQGAGTRNWSEHALDGNRASKQVLFEVRAHDEVIVHGPQTEREAE